jgi:hypothetical protein
MKTVESSAVFQPKQWPEKASREDNRKQDPTRTCAQSGVKSNVVRGALMIDTTTQRKICPQL